MQKITRPDFKQYQQYSLTPSYQRHGSDEDVLAILACQVKIWDAKDKDWFNIPGVNDESCLVLREVSSIEVSSSYKDLIGKAVIQIPRGTVIAKRKRDAKVVTGTAETNTVYTKSSLQDATADGDTISTQTALYEDNGKSITSMEPKGADIGLLDINKTKTETALLQPGDIAIGNRIEIRLGYAYSELEFELMKEGEGKDCGLELVFTGFITSVSASTPLEIECENMAHLLSTISVPYNITDKSAIKVTDFLGSGSKYNLLGDSGIVLSPDCQDLDITVSGSTVGKDVTVADLISNWEKAGIMSYMDLDDATGKSVLKVGYPINTGKSGGALPNGDKRYITYTKDNTVCFIQFDWDVARDNLSLVRTDKKYLAVEAQGRSASGEYFKLVVRKLPDSDDEWISDTGGNYDYEGNFAVTNKRKMTKLSQKRTGGTKTKVTKTTKSGGMTTTTSTSSDGTTSTRTSTKGGSTTTTTKADGTTTTTSTSKTKTGKTTTTTTTTTKSGGDNAKINLKNYNVVPYISDKPTITEEELIEEAKQYWSRYVPNGISGSLSVFGDLHLRPAQIVALIDMRQPEKNGYYLVESVNISFGMDGYRKELKLPYKIGSFKNVTVL